jgi:hypothetical protein
MLLQKLPLFYFGSNINLSIFSATSAPDNEKSGSIPLQCFKTSQEPITST